jgi:hypothetical protein
MATLHDVIDQVTPTWSTVHLELQMLIQQNRDGSYIVYSMPSCSWISTADKDQVLTVTTARRAAADGWLCVGMRVELPGSDNTATCGACRWFFQMDHGYYAFGEYSYCSECCNW